MFENQSLNKHVMGSNSEESSSICIDAYLSKKILHYIQNDKIVIKRFALKIAENTAGVNTV